MPHIIAAIWSQIERSLFPAVEEALEQELSCGLKRVISTLEVVRIEEHVRPACQQMRGRPRASRASYVIIRARLKDEFGCRYIRVRGAAKMHQHVMFGVLALCADALLKMAAGAS